MEETRWLTESEQRAWRRTAAVMTLLPAALDAQLQRDAGLTQFAYLVLAMLSEAPDRSMTMSGLATTVSSSLSRLSHVVTRLESQDWVRRVPCPENGRVTYAVLTDAGFAKVASVAPGHAAEVQRLVFGGLPTDGEADLDAVMGAILGRLAGAGQQLPGRATPQVASGSSGACSPAASGSGTDERPLTTPPAPAAGTP